MLHRRSALGDALEKAQGKCLISHSAGAADGRAGLTASWANGGLESPGRGNRPKVPRAAATGSAADFLPDQPTLPKLREAAADCRGCHLWEVGTQTVFGEGARGAEVMFVGEQPGDQEDRAGRPFVGPAGRLLDEALVVAGIDRSTTYVTNAVKHFKWQ